MTIGGRIKKVRIDAGLNQTEFAEKLNLSKSSISIAESDKSSLSKRALIDIGEKFNVNLDWLETGEGEPYLEPTPAVMKLLTSEYNLDEVDKKIIEAYLSLSPIERQVFKDFVKKIKGAN